MHHQSRWGIVLMPVILTAAFAHATDSLGRLPNAKVGEPYSQRVGLKVAGVPPFKYSFDTSGDQPEWLTLSDTPQGVVLSGTPPAGSAKAYTLRVVAADSSESAQKTMNTFTLAVGDAAPITMSTEATSGGKPICKPLSILTGLKPGSTTLKGTATPSQGSTDIKVQVDAIYGAANAEAALYALRKDNELLEASASKGIRVGQTLYFRKTLPLQDSASSRVGADGTFSVQLAEPLGGGETIIVTQQGCQFVSARAERNNRSAGRTEADYIPALKSTTPKVQNKKQKVQNTKQTTTNNTPRKQGLKPTTGPGISTAEPSGATNDRSEVPTLRYVSLQQDSGNPAQDASPAGDEPSSSQGEATAYSVPGGIDWGRVKALFMIGALFSNQDQSFSQSNLFASFDIDKAWKLPCNYGYAHTAAGYRPFPGDDCSMRPGLNTFFETRLTAIPVSSNAATDSKAAQGGDAGSTDVTSFLSNKKSARFSLGLYTPFLLTRWTHDEGPQALYIAPLVKAGFDTLTDSTSIAATTTDSGGAATPTTAQVPRLYNFFGGGVRIGHYKLHNDENEAPDHVSHLDVMLAKFSNFESKVSNCPAGFATCRARLWRLSFEGLLEIPTPDAFPLYVGLGANVGQKAFGASHVVPGGDAGDDLRFFFGTRLDLGSLVSKLKGGSGSASNGPTDSAAPQQ